MVVVGVGYHLSFLRHVRCLLGHNIAERIVSERRDAACRVADFRAAVSHVVQRRETVLIPTLLITAILSDTRRSMRRKIS